MHIDVIGRDQDGEDAKNQGGIEFVGEGSCNAVLLAVGEAVGGEIWVFESGSL